MDRKHTRPRSLSHRAIPHGAIVEYSHDAADKSVQPARRRALPSLARRIHPGRASQWLVLKEPEPSRGISHLHLRSRSLSVGQPADCGSSASRVNPNKTSFNDWDYLINPSACGKPTKSLKDIKASAKQQLPKGRPQTDSFGNTRSGADVERNVPIESGEPSVTFHP